MQKKSINLVLAGGGARGYVHIGVIEVLLEKGYKINSISGTSMGALIGAMVACGKLEEYKKWVTSLSLLDIITLLKIDIKDNILNSTISLQKVFKEMKKFTGELNIEELKIPFTAVATNLTKKKEIWFQKGNLYDALQASTAIPGYFTPFIMKNGDILVDGGVLNTTPIAPTLNTNADLTVVVDINANIKNDYKIKDDNTFLEKMCFNFLSNKNDLKSLSINLMMDYISNLRINEYKPDILIPFSRDLANTFAFHKHKEIIEIGKIEAYRYL
jgi:NTE family protein